MTIDFKNRKFNQQITVKKRNLYDSTPLELPKEDE